MKSESALWGANKERTATIAKVRRLLKTGGSLKDLIPWLLTRNERYSKRKGGL